jgi:hypothetical protein
LTINFGFDDRTILVGGTGSGKTTVSKKIINTYFNASKGLIPIYILDTKLFGDFKDYYPFGRTIFSPDVAPDPFVPNEKDGSFLIWQCPTIDETDTGVFGQFFQKIFDRREPFLLYIDEISSMTSQSGRKFPKSLELIYKQGRALNMGTILCTQSVSYFPKVCLTQSSKAIRMNLNDEFDIKKLSRIMGKAVEKAPDGKFGFWYKDLMTPVKHSPPLEFKDVKQFFTGK